MSLRDIQKRDSELDNIYEYIHKVLTNIKTGKSEDPKIELTRCAAKLKEYFSGLEFIKLELRELDDESRRTYRKKFKEHKAKYSEVLNAVKQATAASNRDELLEEDSGSDERSTEDKYIREGDELLDSNKAILQATLQRVHEARELGESGITKLKEQNEQLAGVSDNLEQMEDSLKVSQRLLRQISRRMLTDKYLWLMIGLVAIAILGCILTQIYAGEEK